MTYTSAYTIWCDGDECSKWSEYQVMSISYAVERARDEGWSSPSWDEHYCPECSGGSSE